MSGHMTRFALLSLLAVAVACNDEDEPAGPPQQNVAQLRIVNAADFPDVQVRRTGSATPLAQDLDFRQSTSTCVTVPLGEQALIFSSGGTELRIAAGTFEANESYTAILVGSGATVRAVVLPDTVTAAAGSNALRFINATSAAGDVYVTPPGGAVGAGFLATGNMGVLATSNSRPDYVNRSTEHTQVRLFDPQTTTGTPRADIALTGLTATRLATVVFTDAGSPAGPTAFLVAPCP